MTIRRTARITGGLPGQEKTFDVIQRQDMKVTAFEIDNSTGERSSTGIDLGVFGDVDHFEVQQELLERLTIPQ